MNAVYEENSKDRQMGTGVKAPARIKKRLIRRQSVDRSQPVRHWIQGLFVLLNLWIGWEFYLFVLYCESEGLKKFADRPAGAEGWLPIAALMNL